MKKPRKDNFKVGMFLTQERWAQETGFFSIYCREQCSSECPRPRCMRKAGHTGRHLDWDPKGDCVIITKVW